MYTFLTSDTNEYFILNILENTFNQLLKAQVAEPFIQLAALANMMIMPKEPTIGHLVP